MAESNFGSQESLILSQETYGQLFRQLDGSLSNIVHHDLEMPLMDDQACDALVNNYINSYVNQLENNLQEEAQSKEDFKPIEWGSVAIPKQYVGHEKLIEQKRQVSSLPASEDWPGAFTFSVSFNPQTVKKGNSWLFSKDRRKLYVCKDVPCPVNFSVNTTMPEEVYIRAMALFSDSDHALDVVTRCVNHSVNEIRKNIFEAEHIIRCESQNAFYEIDSVTGRHSVIIPFENPPAGQLYSTYLYKFMCFGSCSGGPNRRALMVVFTLERRGEVIGRQKINLKVCACPMRDFKTDGEKQPQVQGQILKENKPVKRENPAHLLLTNLPKRRKEDEEKVEYTVKTCDKGCYEFLRLMKRVYTLGTFYSNVKSNYPELSRFMYTSSQSSSDTDTEKTSN